MPGSLTADTQSPARKGIETPDLLPGASIWSRARMDFSEALRRWNLIVLLGASDVASRYRRSSLGQFWITLSCMVLD